MALSCNSKFTKFIAVFLAVLLFVFCFSAPKAHAVVAEAAAAAVVVAGASYVIASILIAMGIRPGSNSTDFNALRDAVVLHLQGLGFVTADGKITLYGLGAGLACVGAKIIDAIRNYLFSNSISSSSFYNPPVISNHANFTLSSASDCYISVSDFVKFIDSTVYGSAFHAIITAQSIDLASVKFISCSGTVSGTTNFLAVTYSSSSSLPMTFVSDSGDGYWKSTAYCTYIRYFLTSDYVLDGVSSSSANFYYIYSHSTAPLLACNAGFVGTSLNASGDIVISGVPSSAADADSTSDVIWPGWADESDIVDTNISVDLDNDGAIDNIVPYDRYYPISIPWDLTDVLTWSQEKAQEGSLVDTADLTTSPGSSTNDWLPVLGNGFSFPSIWHYVTEWLSYISSFVTKISSVWSVLPWGMVVPVYACIVLIITFGIYRKFIK